MARLTLMVTSDKIDTINEKCDKFVNSHNSLNYSHIYYMDSHD